MTNETAFKKNGEYHAQYERRAELSLRPLRLAWVWTGGGLEARQGVGTRDWGSPYDTTLKQNNKPSPIQTPRFGAGAQHKLAAVIQRSEAA